MLIESLQRHGHADGRGQMHNRKAITMRKKTAGLGTIAIMAAALTAGCAGASAIQGTTIENQLPSVAGDPGTETPGHEQIDPDTSTGHANPTPTESNHPKRTPRKNDPYLPPQAVIPTETPTATPTAPTAPPTPPAPPTSTTTPQPTLPTPEIPQPVLPPDIGDKWPWNGEAPGPSDPTAGKGDGKGGPSTGLKPHSDDSNGIPEPGKKNKPVTPGAEGDQDISAKPAPSPAPSPSETPDEAPEQGAPDAEGAKPAPAPSDDRDPSGDRGADPRPAPAAQPDDRDPQTTPDSTAGRMEMVGFPGF